MKTKTIMLQGTSSDVGKSVLTAALCRILYNDGKKVAPFKAQNMALNSFVTQSGHEIGRAQAVQAEASGISPTCDMNPILLKPTSNMVVQVIIQGKAIGNFSATEYQKFKQEHGMKPIKESFTRLSKEFPYIVIEGAGSPVEINLKQYDLVNMKIAKMTNSPVILVADIDKGGVFAQLVGTMELLDEDEKDLIAGFIINKFRGDISLLKSGLEFLEKRTGKPVLGVIPYINDIGIDEEDSISKTKIHRKKEKKGKKDKIFIDVIQLPHISNFTDFDSLKNEDDVILRFIKNANELHCPDILIIPGTKNTIEDMLFLNKNGFTEKILNLRQSKTMVIGICGGYQMLGEKILDPFKMESDKNEINGLALLSLTTTLNKNKTTKQVLGKTLNIPFYKGKITGYEIHLGETKINNYLALFCFKRDNKEIIFDGFSNKNFSVWGTYLHGIFDNDRFRRNLLNFVRKKKGLRIIRRTFDNSSEREKKYDQLAEIVKNNLDMEKIYKLIG